MTRYAHITKMLEIAIQHAKALPEERQNDLGEYPRSEPPLAADERLYHPVEITSAQTD